MNPAHPQPIDAAQTPRFAEIATFMRLPHITDPKALDIALIGVPWDGGTTNRPGARHGPRQMRDMSTMMRRVHPTSKVAPYELARIADFGDAPCNPIDIMDSLAQIEAFYAGVHAAGCVPLTAGGDHLITLPIMRAIARQRPVGMIHIDAHCDTNDTYFGGHRYTHGTPFRRAVEEGLLDPKRTVQIGIRASLYTPNDNAFSHDSGMRVIEMEEVERIGIDAVIAEARRVVGEGQTYLSFDVDGLDPVFAPGTGTPEVGGLTTREALTLLRGLRGVDLIGGDVVEVSPPFDASGNTALVGVTMMFEIMCLLSECVAARTAGNGGH